MAESKKILFVFTESYPFGHCDDFIHEELTYHTRNFKTVYVLPLFEFRNEKQNFTLPDGVELASFNVYAANKTLQALALNLTIFLRLFFTEMFISNDKANNCSYFFKNWRQVLNNIVLARRLRQFIISKGEVSNTVVYSYWFNRWVFSLAILKLWLPKLRIFTRAHGSDLYLHKVYNRSFFPLRSFQLKQVDRVYCISSDGQSYLEQSFPRFAKKITLSRLGVREGKQNLLNTDKTLYLVSCAHLTDLKRIHLIPKILKDLAFDFKWIHFGDGPEMKNVQQAVAANNLQERSILAGLTSHNNILKFYSEKSVFAFLNVSETEGIPVSIMEAISFGIPALATNVGGNKEIVTPLSGLLIDEHFDPSKIAASLNKIYVENRWNTAFRNGVKRFWDDNYNLEKNYKKFSLQLTE